MQVATISLRLVRSPACSASFYKPARSVDVNRILAPHTGAAG
jgi:hypothetical protein